eukprot:CAMPEP_0171703772 /NCGR_PEP_ID=MMETSP0991-20121206/12312_1 /TAXON_ID=483369 /ORGANISM="non described non described, Strain CCMP2098" /LENGTH=86 /DNA_ID=CAMNT_0012293213 /DNA_START=186 /DNA_END=446 /DNA_ORIENTATION=-
MAAPAESAVGSGSTMKVFSLLRGISLGRLQLEGKATAGGDNAFRVAHDLNRKTPEVGIKGGAPLGAPAAPLAAEQVTRAAHTLPTG